VRLGRGRAVQHQAELLAAVPVQHVVAAQRVEPGRGGPLEQLIAGLVPVRVVEFLEMIEVEQDDREGPPGGLGPDQGGVPGAPR
jgi:hypothetical protein